jgi:hypothetical protein
MDEKYGNINLEDEGTRYQYNQGVYDYVMGLPEDPPKGFLGEYPDASERAAYVLGYRDARGSDVQTDITKELVENREDYDSDTQKRIDMLA